MRVNNYFKLVIAVGIVGLAGMIGSLFTAPAIRSGWYDALAKPAFNPPAAVFGPVWVALYLLMGIALFLVWKNDWRINHRIMEREKRAWNHYSERLWTGSWQKANVKAIIALQLFLNALWPALFFGLKSPGFAFVEILTLWFAILFTVMNVYRISKAAAYLLIPYLLWVSFASFLNYAIWRLN